MQKPATNRVFRIPELLHLIVQELDTPRDLARMARVATVSHLPSIQALWSGKSSHFFLGSGMFHHLLQLLPEELLVQQINADSSWSICRSPLATDWVRVRHYSVYIKFLIIELADYSIDIFSFFNDAKPNLFPKLRTMELPDDIRYSHIGWKMLEVPSLKTLRLGDTLSPTRTGLDDISAFCRQLPGCTPQLQRLDLPPTEALGSVWNDGEDTTLTAIKSLTNLTEFSWIWDRQLSKRVTEFIGMHPRLTKVSFGHVEQWVEGVGVKGKWLPSLTELELVGMDLGMESVLKQLAHPESLARVFLKYAQLSSHSSGCFALSTLCQATNITAMTIAFNADNLRMEDIEFNSISPVFNCKKMTAFTLSASAGMEGLNDDAMRKIADSWPELEEIYTFTDPPIEDEGQDLPTVVGLAALANSCPRLRIVTMTIVFTCCEYYQAYGDPRNALGRQSRTLELLDLEWSRWYDDWGCRSHTHPEATARILRDIWPTLKSEQVRVLFSSELPEERHLFERWQRVKQCLTHMEAIAQRDGVNSALQKERDMLEEECARLRHELTEAKRTGMGP